MAASGASRSLPHVPVKEHEDAFPRSRLSARCRLAQRTLAYPEVTASVVYTMHDMLCAAGRDSFLRCVCTASEGKAWR
jgi:hypothetical protein